MTSPRDAGDGAASRAAGEGKAAGKGASASASASKGGKAGGVEIELLHARNHHLRWLVLGSVLGVLCVTQLGTLGQMLGVLLLVLAAWAGYRVVQTLRHPPGTLVVDGDRVVLPRGLCVGDPLTVRRGEVGAAYLLRKAVAWPQSAPVLVVEAGGKVLAYPRDWFASEADQRRVLDALLGETSASAPVEPAA